MKRRDDPRGRDNTSDTHNGEAMSRVNERAKVARYERTVRFWVYVYVYVCVYVAGVAVCVCRPLLR